MAAFFAGLGIWLGGTLTRKKPEVVVREVPVEVRVRELNREDVGNGKISFGRGFAAGILMTLISAAILRRE